MKEISEGNGIKYFLYGGVELGISKATGDPNYTYPLLWMEQPTCKFIRNPSGLWTLKYYMGVNILTSVSGHLDDEVDASDECQKLLGQIIKRLYKDVREAKFITLSNDFEMDEIDRNWANNHVGWRASFEIEFLAQAVKT